MDTGRKRPERGFPSRTVTVLGGEQQLLLNARIEKQQVHDLSEPRARYVAQASDVGVVAELTAVDHVLELDGEGHQARDSWNARWRGFRCRLSFRRPSGPPGPIEGDILFVLFVHFAGPFWQYSLMPFEL